MSVPVSPKPHRIRTPRPLPPAAAPAAVALAAAAGVTAIATAPAPARVWAAVTVTLAWAAITAGVVFGTLNARRLRIAAAAAEEVARAQRTRSARADEDVVRLLEVTLPLVVKRLRDGEGADAVLGDVPQPAHPLLRAVLAHCAAELAAGESVARAATADSVTAVRRLARAADELDRLTSAALPEALARLRAGDSADTVLAALKPPGDDRVRILLDTVVREVARSERRAAAVMGAGTKTLSRVQAMAVSMLADLRELQDRHGGEVFGELLRLDHKTSQLGLLADRLSLLMGGRTSRTWNKPIGMESVLRGAVGRISAYRRVRLHSTSTARIAGYAAESVMHLLAELMDNAANFSPPVDEVHVYVEERAAGLVVTVEDSGLKMAEAQLRRAEEAVSGRAADLSRLPSTRIGLVVVGLLAVKFHMTVTYRPSSRGGTGVVVLLPPQLLHQDQLPYQEKRQSTAGLPDAPGPGERRNPGAVPPAAAPRPVVPPPRSAAAPGGPGMATPNGLPVRPRGRTMAAADRGRTEATGEPSGASGPTDGAGRNAGAQFDAFHRSMTARSTASGEPAGPAAENSRP
ncbi:sensor histidine kinase [Streptomyces qinzhouensis]|uniref:histidine kinase n=1 Tax=Streptomyces qinzhouensis TaxID=2599401 RepID=A0A5B8IEV0_9ACTN|nr:ATP-binding protein [Streptomyces qinzhouensis]QDY75719.1 sensor histidine kinase [Streptomyces qinzhouensis]